MLTFLQDLRYGARMLARAPGFAAVAIVTLALGIGANTAVFSVVNAAMLRRPHFQHLERLLQISETNPQKGWKDLPASPANFLDWREQNHVFDHIAAWRTWFFGVSGDGEPEQVWGVRTSANFFDLLGVRPALGRAFLAEEEQPGHDQVVLLSHGFWQRRYGAETAVVGRKITIDGRPFTVVGVLPRDFQFFRTFYDLWMPFALDRQASNREEHSVAVFARLRPGVTIWRAEAEMIAIAQRLGQAYPATNAGWAVGIEPLHPYRAGNWMRRALWILLGAVALVLLIACANVANLLLARAVSRQREIAIRMAVGARRGRLVRQLLTESVLLAALAGAAGLLLAHALIGPIARFAPPLTVFTPGAYGIDNTVLAFTLLVSLATGVIFGLAPALRSARQDLAGALKLAASRRTRASASRALVVSELALSMVLLAAAGLLLKSFWHLLQHDPGFRPDHVLTMQVWLPQTKYPDGSHVAAFYREVLRRTSALPSVESASAINFRPLLGWGDVTEFAIEGRPPAAPRDVPFAHYRVAGPDYFRTMRIPLLQGRDLSETDGPHAAGVVVIDQALARRYWPNEDPIGKRLHPNFGRSKAPWRPLGDAQWLIVVGVVAEVKDLLLSDKPRPELYLSHLQYPSPLMFLVARSGAEPASLAAAIEKEVHTVDPTQPVSDVKTMTQAVEEAAARPRFNLVLLGAFAALAVMLAAVGVYGVMAYSVSQRTHEMGVRMALGARQSDVLALVLRQGGLLTAIGIALGLAGSLVVTRVMRGLLFEVSATDPMNFATVAVLLAAIALAACYLPARRAARVDPMIALRQE